MQLDACVVVIFCVSLSIVEDSQFESAVIIQLSKVTISILQAACGQFRRVVSSKIDGVEDEGFSSREFSFGFARCYQPRAPHTSLRLELGCGTFFQVTPLSRFQETFMIVD